jgi:hypothetical protein
MIFPRHASTWRIDHIDPGGPGESWKVIEIGEVQTGARSTLNFGGSTALAVCFVVGAARG